MQPATSSVYCVYLLECRGGRLYAGITTDIRRRFAEHCGSKKAAKFMRMHPAVKLLAVQHVAGRPAALRLEAALKKLGHAQKLAWAAQHDPLAGGTRRD